MANPKIMAQRSWQSDHLPGVNEHDDSGTYPEVGDYFLYMTDKRTFICTNQTQEQQEWIEATSTNGFQLFTPVIEGSIIPGTATYNTQLGRYVKIGSVVVGWLKLIWSASNGTGNMLITGLPFTINSAVPSIVNFQFENLLLPIGGLSLNGILTSKQIAVMATITNSVSIAMPMSSGGTLQTSFFYST